MGRIFGYVRVSTAEQKLDRQVESLKKYVTDEKFIFSEKRSGKDLERPVLRSLVDVILTEGDTLYVHSLDRLGRNKNDIQKVLSLLKEKKVLVRILDIPTSMVEIEGDTGKLIFEMINNVMIEVLGYVAEQERRNITKRREEGVAVARAKGTHMGRRYKAFPQSWETDYQDWKAGKVTAVSLIKKYQWSAATFYSRVKKYESGFKFDNCIEH